MSQTPFRRARRALLLAFVTVGATACASAPASKDVGVRALPPGSEPAPPATSASDGLSKEFHDAFAAADARARAVVYWQQCVSTVARLRATGSFGAAASAPRALHCARTDDGVPVGGVYDIDSSYRAVRRLQLVRLDGARPKYTDPIDTARIATQAKLARDVNKVVSAAWTKRSHPFSVVPIVVSGTAEAWVIPRATKARSFVTGGDVGYRAGGDGTPVVIDDHTATWTQLTLPANGPLMIYSSVREIAAVTDLATARYQHDLGREVQVSTPVAVSTLVAGVDSATGARVVWQHQKR